MASSNPRHETFAEFKNSFAYGSRTDLNFKFLKSLPSEEGAAFLQQLLWKVGDSFVDGDIDRLVQHVYEGQVQAYAGASHWTYEDGPFTPLEKPLAACRLGLLTSSGHFAAGHDPEPFGVKDMSQAEATARIDDFLKAEPELSAIPADTPMEQLRVRHGGYDIRATQADANVVFPLGRLRELAQEGVIGELAPEAYSFVGACAQTRLLKHAGPQWVGKLKEQQVDAALLVPA
ncbi:MAG: D-proline reductase subunit gamma [Anaerolineales bacterium]|nr:D-proline reductase subunit gamma [Anaerolineales bacterium]